MSFCNVSWDKLELAFLRHIVTFLSFLSDLVRFRMVHGGVIDHLMVLLFIG